MNDYYKHLFVMFIDIDDEEQIHNCGNTSNLGIAINWWHNNGYIEIISKVSHTTTKGNIRNRSVYTFTLTDLGKVSWDLYQL